MNKFYWVYKLRNIRVIDGDTIEADIDSGHNRIEEFQVIRFNGIDTPETRGESKEIGIAVARWVRQWINEACENGSIWIKSIQKKDSFGRWICDIHSQGSEQSLNSILLDKKLARVYKSKEPFDEELILDTVYKEE